MKRESFMISIFVFSLTTLSILVFSLPASSGNFRHDLNNNESFSVRCVGGNLSQPKHTGGEWRMTCTKSGTQPPVEPQPPARNCAARNPMPYKTRPFQYGKDPRGFIIDPGRSVSTPFTMQNLRNRRMSIVTAGHNAQGASQPAFNHTISISDCPGDFNLQYVKRSCYSGGADSAMNVVGGFNSVGTCRIDGGTYWINVTAGNAITGASQCRGNCGAIQSIK